METVHKLEIMVAQWYKDVPHLPVGGRKWLADNAWWLALIGAVLSALAILPLLGATMFAGIFAAGFGPVYGASVAGVYLLSMWITLALTVVEAVLLAMAVSPLKAHQKRGWDLLFATVVVTLAVNVVDSLLKFGVMELIWSVITAAIGAYFLFEMRSSFGTAKTAHSTGKKEARHKTLKA